MSVAAAKPVLALPHIKQRSWSTAAVVLIDIVALQLAVLLGCLIRIFLQRFYPITLGTSQYLGVALGLLSLPLVYWWMGLYPGFGMGAVERLRARVHATFSVFVVLLIWDYVFQDRQWSRGVLLTSMFFALTIPPLLEALFRKTLVQNGICGLPVIVMGAGSTGALVVNQLQTECDLGFVPVGVLDDDSQKWGSDIRGVPVLGPLSLVHQMTGRAKAVVIAMPSLHREQLSEMIQTLSFANIIIVPDLFGIQSLWITSRDLGGVLGLEVRKNLLVRSNRILKRILDYSIALPATLISLPIVGISALWIKLVSPGPALFTQRREGQNGEEITVFKIRTMYPDAEKVLQEYLDSHPEENATWTRFYKLKKDPRVLPGIGWFLRRYSLDELPQFWNVLRGDMSLVGPRPFPFYHLDSFPATFRSLRTSVMPGLTGLWQVSDRSDGDVAVQERIDTYYIRNWSMWLDVFILLKTVHRVINPKGAY